MLTGRYGFRTGVGAYFRTGYPALPLNEFALAEAFNAKPDLDYQLASIGKWHLSDGLTDPNKQGWTYHAGAMPGGGALGNYFNWAKIVNGVRTNTTVYATTDQVDEALGAIRRATAGGRPFMVWLGFNAPHAPYHVPPIALHSQKSLAPYAAGLSPRPYYEAMIEAMDTEIGRLLAEVDLKTTTVIFVGDNGTPGAVIASPYSRARGKSTIYEGGIRVPLLIAGAGVAAPGRVVGSIVNSVDLYPTILELAGINASTVVPPGTTMDGISMVPYLTSPTAPALRTWVYSERFDLNSSDRYARAIRNATFKLIERADGSREFYNLKTDPRETNNLLLLGAMKRTERSNLLALDRQLDQLLASP